MVYGARPDAPGGGAKPGYGAALVLVWHDLDRIVRCLSRALHSERLPGKLDRCDGFSLDHDLPLSREKHTQKIRRAQGFPEARDIRRPHRADTHRTLLTLAHILVAILRQLARFQPQQTRTNSARHAHFATNAPPESLIYVADQIKRHDKR